MLLVDTSVWIDHFRRSGHPLADSLESRDVLCHPWVRGELALGSLAARSQVLRLLAALPQALVASADEVMRLVDLHALQGTGIGWVDAQLLTSARLTPGATLWTADKRLAGEAGRLGVAHRP